MSLQFRDKAIRWNSVKCFVEVQVDDVCHLSTSLIHQHCKPILGSKEATKFLRLDLLLAKLAVTNHLLIFLLPQHGFQADLCHNLARSRGETDQPVVPWLFHFSLLKNNDNVSYFPVSGSFTGLP